MRDPFAEAASDAATAPRAVNGRREKRERILAAGLRLFANQAYQQVTMDQVARLARVAKGTLYLYFPSKESLYVGIIAEGFQAAAKYGLESASAPHLSADDRLQRAIDATIEFYHSHKDFLRLLATEEPRVAAARDRLLAEWRQRGFRFFSTMIEEGIASGRFRPIDPHLAAFAIIGMIRSALLYGGSRRTAAELSRELARLLFNGLMAERPILARRTARR